MGGGARGPEALQNKIQQLFLPFFFRSAKQAFIFLALASEEQVQPGHTNASEEEPDQLTCLAVGEKQRSRRTGDTSRPTRGLRNLVFVSALARSLPCGHR